MASVEGQVGGTAPRNEAEQRWVSVRQRVRGLLTAQAERMRQVEGKLGEQVAALLEQVKAEQAQAQQRETQLQEQISQLEQNPASPDTRQEAEALLEEARVTLSDGLRVQHELKAQLSDCRQRLKDREEEVGRLRGQLSDAASHSAGPELAELEAERNRLQERLAEAEEKLEAAGDASQLDEMRERFEKAVQEVRGLKTENAKLQKAGARPRSEAKEVSGQNFDWETQKQRLLAQLETDFDAGDNEQAQDKLTVEGAIRITDQVVSEKEREIAELKKLLDDQSNTMGEVAVGAAAVAGLLDNDQLVQEERDSLKRLQEEWREKLRQAEVDISVERAKLARDRVELEERIRNFESERASRGPADKASPGGAEPGKKSSGGNWLARLGLKEDDE